MSRLARLLLVALFCLSANGLPALAQEAAPKTETETGIDRQQVDALVKTLEDPAKRDELLTQLKALSAVEQQRGQEVPAGTAGGRFLATLSDRIEDVSQQIAEAGQAIIDAPRALRWLDQQVSDPAKRMNWLRLLVHLVAIIGAGYAARWLTIWLVAKPRKALGARGADHLWTKVPLLLARLIIDMLPMAAFAIAGFGVLSLSDAPRPVRLASLTILNASLIVQGVIALARFLLSPTQENLRLLPVGDETAHYLVIWTRRITIIGVYGYFIAEAALVLGLPLKPHAALLKLVGLVVTAMLIVLILQNRQAVAGWIRGDHLREPVPPPPVPDAADEALRAVIAGESGGSDAEIIDGTTPATPTPTPAAPTPVQHRPHRGRAVRAVRRRLADVWHILAILYLTAIYFIWALGIAGGFDFVLRATLVTGAILIGSRLIGEGFDRAVDRGFSISPELQAQYPGLERRANRYLPVLHKLLKGALWLFTLILLLQSWGANALGWFDTSFGQRVTASAVTILIVLTVSLIIWEMVSGAIYRYLNAKDTEGTAIQRSARMRTLLPLARNALMILMVTMVGLIVLSEVGVNIAPLLAGAGVVGLAIGFGAQTLVKDVITGLFMLIEDTLSVGDVVNVGGKGGSVEAITIRTIRLRDYDGSVHTIPFSSVTTASNLTKDFSFYVLNISIEYDEEPGRVIAVLQDIAEQMRAEPAYANAMLGPIEIAGVDAFQDNAVVIKGRLKTRPIQQWNVGREFNRRMLIRFQQENISIPYPQRTLHIANGAMLVPQRPDQAKEVGARDAEEG